ncbi:hypothetical protein [Fibrella arboris]|uniref:hypothetical protein n=1 Tax=Fibrella arboris TaxID=3242486 RepID=UPI00351FB537
MNRSPGTTGVEQERVSIFLIDHDSAVGIMTPQIETTSPLSRRYVFVYHCLNYRSLHAQPGFALLRVMFADEQFGGGGSGLLECFQCPAATHGDQPIGLVVVLLRSSLCHETAQTHRTCLSDSDFSPSAIF